MGWLFCWNSPQGPGRKADHSSSAADHVEGMHAVSPDQGSNSGGSIPETQPGSQAAQTGDRPTLLHAQVSHATIAGHSTTNVSPSLPAASAHIKPIEPIAGGPQLLPAPTVQREQIVFGQLQHQAVTQPAGLGKRPSSVLDANNIAEPVKAARTVDLTSQNPVAPN